MKRKTLDIKCYFRKISRDCYFYSCQIMTSDKFLISKLRIKSKNCFLNEPHICGLHYAEFSWQFWMWTCVFWLLFTSGSSSSSWLNYLYNFSRKECSPFHIFCLLSGFISSKLKHLGPGKCLLSLFISNFLVWNILPKYLPIVLADWDSFITFISTKVWNTWFPFTIIAYAFI